MQIFQITETRDFMAKLLTTELFDTFLVSEGSITTFTTFRIDGSFHPDYFCNPEDEAEAEKRKDLSSPVWKMIRPFFFDLVKGKHTPLNFRIVLRLADYNVEKLLIRSGIPMRAADIAGLFLNIHYDGSRISCTTGSSVRIFTMDKALDHAWDDMIGKFFRQSKIPYL